MMSDTALHLSEQNAGGSLPALIAEAGERAAWRFVEFFAVNIRNRNTRAAYAQAVAAFLPWCEGRGIDALGHGVFGTTGRKVRLRLPDSLGS